MTNAFLHANPSQLTIELDCNRQSWESSIIADRIGLPDNYEYRGHGFRDMSASMECLGGELQGSSGGGGVGTIVACAVPYEGANTTR